MTMQEYLDAGMYGSAFRDWYLVPQIAAVWSASAQDALAFPARTLIRFCVNHSLVQVLDRPQWRTVSRGSREYVRRIVAALPSGRSEVLLSSRVVSVRRRRVARGSSGGGGSGASVLVVTDAHGTAREYDHVIFAVHPGDAAAMLVPEPAGSEGAAAAPAAFADEDASAAATTLREFVYQDNVAVLHTDAALMPSRRSAYASWNFMGTGTGAKSGGAVSTGSCSSTEPCCVTYWLNRLQPCLQRAASDDGRPFPQLFLTLNPPAGRGPAASSTLRTFSYAHPQYTKGTVAAQAALERLQVSARRI
jgi:uncharacterized protein